MDNVFERLIGISIIVSEGPCVTAMHFFDGLSEAALVR